MEKKIHLTAGELVCECLACGWKGKEKELDLGCHDDGYPPIKSPGCPECKSIAWEYLGI